MFLNRLHCIVRAGRFKAATDSDEWGNPILISLNHFFSRSRSFWPQRLDHANLSQHLVPSHLHVLKLGTKNFYLGISDTVMAEGHVGMGSSNQFSRDPF